MGFLGFFSAKIKGFFGEKKISAILSFLPAGKYFVLNNIMLATDTGTSQIDHVVVSNYGIFVIETKNYKGWIMGKESDEFWVQNIYGKKNRFKNPIRQNFGHVKALESLLSQYRSIRIIPIVAFSGEATLKVSISSANVCYMTGVNQIIKRYQEEIISADQVQEIVKLIQSMNIDSYDNRKVHVNNIREKVHDYNAKVSNMICPKCGNALVERNGRYGRFTGCSNYPGCKFIVKK